MTKFEKRRNEIDERKLELRALLKSDTAEFDMDEVMTELDGFEDELRNMERREEALTKLKKDDEVRTNENDEEVREISNFQTGESRDVKEKKSAETRGKTLKEGRSISVGSSSVVLPKPTSDTINGTFNPVSALVDRVASITLPGGESYEQPYVSSYGVGAYNTNVTGDANDVETIFGFASMAKTNIDAYQEWPKQVEKLAPAAYASIVQEGIRKAVRTKLSYEIMIGDGTTGHLIGIFDDGATAIDSTTDKSIGAIASDTLDDIIYDYGGLEEVEDDGVLILNKKDLRDFAKLRTTDGMKVHDIVRTNQNSGTIDNTPYIINSRCEYLKDATVGDYCMAYGPLSAYLLTIFSDLDVQRSDDYKFKSKQVAFLGEIYAAGNVVMKNGFLRVKKG